MIFSELQKRILTALITLPIVVFIILFNQSLFVLFLIFLLIFSCKEWHILNKKNFSIESLLGFLIIIFSLFSAYILRGNNEKSIMLFLWIIFVCFFSDTGGYFFGKLMRGKKITKISPKKTYSGMCGSFIFSTFPILIFYLLNNNFFYSNILVLSWETIILSLIFSFIRSCTDLPISGNENKFLVIVSTR